MNVAGDLATFSDASGWSRRPALVTPQGTWTHGEVHDVAARTASVLAGLGVGAGDRVLLALPDGAAWVVTFLAVARLGATAVLVDPDLAAREHARLAGECRTTLCVTGARLEGHVDRWLDAHRLLIAARDASPASARSVSAATELYVQYTAGTTGPPRAVPHAHRDVAIHADTIGRQVLDVRPPDVALSVSRLFHIYGFGHSFVFPLFTGSAAVLTPGRPAVGEVCELLERHRVTLLCGGPSVYAALPADAPGRHLRAVVSAGEALPAAVGARTRTVLGVPVLEQLGCTEVGHAFCATTAGLDEPRTVGRPVPGHAVELRDAAGHPVEDGEPGTAWVRGPSLTRGYLGRPAETAALLVDGRLDTRDRLVRLPSGALRHVGRTDDLETVGGVTVAPQEIERILVEHPRVREAAVAAVPDATGGRRLQAFVVATGGGSAAALEADLLALTRGRLAAAQVPRAVHAVAALPRTATGKLRRHQVREGVW